MTLFLVLLAFVFSACLVLLAAAPALHSHISEPELRRRAKAGDEGAVLALRRLQLQVPVATVSRTLQGSILVFSVITLIAAWGWLWGSLAALAVAVCYPAVARLPFVTRLSARLYGRFEAQILEGVSRIERALMALRNPEASTLPSGIVPKVHSREELFEVLAKSTQALTATERQLLTSALSFSDARVGEVMTPRNMINSIKKGEFLGPLVLDELHALGTSRLPVIDEDIDHIVGILNLRNLLSLDVKKSTTAEKAMDARVYFISEGATLRHALTSFLKTRHHLFIVVNEMRETVGLITLEDVIERLIGQSIMDEDDIHSDLRVAGVQRGKTNNASPGAVDL